MEMYKKFFLVGVCSFSLFTGGLCQSSDLSEKDFVRHFALCKPNSKDFDPCMKTALNNVRHYFKSGVPELTIPPFDPFFAQEIIQENGIPSLGYKLKLKNVHERGWTASMVTKFRSDLKRNRIQVTQTFPEKFLEGEYETEAHLGGMVLTNKGVWNLTLYDLVQTTTIIWPIGFKKPKVYVDVQVIRDLALHISNILGAKTPIDSLVDQIINGMWQPGFLVARPLINDLVSKGFTNIFGDAFRNMDWKRLFPN